ncbi:acetyltransferase [Calycina marina]|uniref:Acetyltransferase n=1 Tax=Calycina marina TaxID=1763456 RepID=A0A9P8CEN1_9HELO|nr:acetyltransferase [Calycina marina]
MARHHRAPLHLPIKELDLRVGAANFNITTTSAVRTVVNAVPGFRSSVAFFFALRANLVQPSSTPLLYASTSPTLPPLPSISLQSSSATSSSFPQPIDPILPLTTDILTSLSDKTAALNLIADSIAQQGQLAARALLLHPLTLAAYVTVLALTSQSLYTSPRDLGKLLTTCVGLTMALLIGVRGLSAGYITHAESITWAYLQPPSPSPQPRDSDILIGSKYGDVIIGALILRLEPPRPSSPSNSKRKAGGKNLKMGGGGGKGVVRAWTTKIRYRGTGIGTALLEEAVRVTKRECGRESVVGFAAEHANSEMVLWEIFNAGFRRRERRAAGALERVVLSEKGRRSR